MLINFSWVLPNKLSASNMPGGFSKSFSELYDDLKQLKTYNINTIVSVMDNLPANFKLTCEANGFENIQYPIVDFDVPTNIESFRHFINNIVLRLHHMDIIHVHCHMGQGRTGLVLACIIGVLNKLNGIDAINFVRSVRPKSIENNKQFKFVTTFLDNIIFNESILNDKSRNLSLH